MAPKRAKTNKQTAAVELLLCGLAPPGQFEAVAAGKPRREARCVCSRLCDRFWTAASYICRYDGREFNPTPLDTTHPIDIQKLLPSEQALSEAELRRLTRLNWARHGGLGRREQNERGLVGEGRVDKVVRRVCVDVCF